MGSRGAAVLLECLQPFLPPCRRPSARQLCCAALLPCMPTHRWDESRAVAMSRMHAQPRRGVETGAADLRHPSP